jgi:D-sedoheptulose 7-phosphate isomerase|tara:strand:- start:1393 stop:1971 length:579 start_codon:yes stop_codon:yes gene_type:complete
MDIFVISHIENELNGHNKVLKKTTDTLIPVILQAAELIIETLEAGGKLLILGNGGSAADAQHMAAEFTGRYLKNRQAFRAIALTTDTSALTAIGNDFGYEYIFSRQVEALANPGDVVLGISTSGKSLNVIKAFDVAKKYGCKIIALTGQDGSQILEYTDVLINIPDNHTPRIQEMHILVIHILCGIVEDQIL